MPFDAPEDDVSTYLVRVALRDRVAFDRLYAATSAKLFGTCLRILRNRSEAEDVLQEVFVKIWLKADKFSVTGQSPMAWLVAIARNQSIDRLRMRREGTAGIDDAALAVSDPGPGPEAQILAGSDRRRLDDCMDELPEERAIAVRGAYLDGDSYADLASRFGVPLNTMRTWLRRSLMRLKTCMEQSA